MSLLPAFQFLPWHFFVGLLLHCFSCRLLHCCRLSSLFRSLSFTFDCFLRLSRHFPLLDSLSFNFTFSFNCFSFNCFSYCYTFNCFSFSFNCSFVCLHGSFLAFDSLSFPIIEAKFCLCLFDNVCILLGENIFLEEFLKEFLVVGIGLHDDLFSLILDRSENAELSHEALPPILAVPGDELIALAHWQGVVFRFVLHGAELVADVHLHELLPAGHGEGGLPVAELMLLWGAVIPDELVEAVAAIVDRAQVLIGEVVDCGIYLLEELLNIWDLVPCVFLNQEGFDDHRDVLGSAFQHQRLHVNFLAQA